MMEDLLLLATKCLLMGGAVEYSTKHLLVISDRIYRQENGVIVKECYDLTKVFSYKWIVGYRTKERTATVINGDTLQEFVIYNCDKLEIIANKFIVVKDRENRTHRCFLTDGRLASDVLCSGLHVYSDRLIWRNNASEVISGRIVREGQIEEWFNEVYASEWVYTEDGRFFYANKASTRVYEILRDGTIKQYLNKGKIDRYSNVIWNRQNGAAVIAIEEKKAEWR